ncbi:pyridoxamine 5'-phosphate oxidase family protein [Actinoallomurus sp. NPDC052274]|uniref:pyridoxamine 5'-phosphate oxidase family protein n=1 Tax=Actinoallomurus sp. NPDC052274 TaxID=3155420 RepID=UPI00342863B0
MTTIDAELAATIAAYRTCEFTTLGRDGTPLTWPTAAWFHDDGTFLVTTSLAFAQKALNVRRDGRVALLFSDPTGSGRPDAPQVFVAGTAVCPEDIRTGPEGAEDYWRMLFERQPHSRGYLRPPARWFMDWYYLRLLITVTPTQVSVRPPLAELAPPEPAGSAEPVALPGADLLAGFPSAVLGARDASGAPQLARTRVTATAGGFAVGPPPECAVVPGPASLLVHRHDDHLNAVRNVLVRGELRADGDDWLLVPDRVVEPGNVEKPREAIRTLRNVRRATRRYLERRSLSRPRVEWDRFRELAR